MEFACSKCGACCRNVRKMKPLEELDYVLPDGSCKMLQPDNTCSIYESRPECCVIGDGSQYGLSTEAWHALNYGACLMLQQITLVAKSNHSADSA